MQVTCAILAKAGPQRSRIFATLYRDERSFRLPNYRILEKVVFSLTFLPLGHTLI